MDSRGVRKLNSPIRMVHAGLDFDMCRTYGAGHGCASCTQSLRTGLTSVAPPALRRKRGPSTPVEITPRDSGQARGEKGFEEFMFWGFLRHD